MINNKIHQEHEHDNHRSDENNDILASLNETDHRQQHSSDYIKENNTWNAIKKFDDLAKTKEISGTYNQINDLLNVSLLYYLGV